MRSVKNFLQKYVSWKNLNFDLLFKPEKYNDNNKIEEISKKIMETMESEIKKVLSEEL